MTKMVVSIPTSSTDADAGTAKMAPSDTVTAQAAKRDAIIEEVATIQGLVHNTAKTHKCAAMTSYNEPIIAVVGFPMGTMVASTARSS